MSSTGRKRCRNCKCLFNPDPRNRKRQRFCGKSACRKASKRTSQRQWLAKPENQDYFRGPEQVARVQAWRRDNPGYARRPRLAEQALQEPLPTQPLDTIAKTPDFVTPALQDVILLQPAVIIGLIAKFTGETLQDDIASQVRHLVSLGQDILTPRRSHEVSPPNAVPRPSAHSPPGQI